MGFFMGITAHHNAKRVTSFATAQQALEAASKTPTGRSRTPKIDGYPLGGHSKSVTWVREEGESIAFRLYDTDVVTWHPNDSVTIENFGTTTTSGFADRFLPRTFQLHFTHRGGGHRGISYRNGASDPRWDHCRSLCWGGAVTFDRHDEDVWLPDEATCTEVRFPGALDQRAARALSKELHLRDFEMWLSMAPRHMRIEHDQWDVDECEDALRKRDFVRVAEHLPLTDKNKLFGGRTDHLKVIPIMTRSWQYVVTASALERLKLALWEAHNLIADEQLRTIRMHDFDKRMVRLRQLREMGMVGWNMGPSQ